MKKIRMTKARERRLHVALSIDDVLYEKFRRLEEKLRSDIQKYYRNPKRVFRILQLRKNGEHFVVPILECNVCEIGTEIIVGEP